MVAGFLYQVPSLTLWFCHPGIDRYHSNLARDSRAFPILPQTLHHVETDLAPVWVVTVSKTKQNVTSVGKDEKKP